MGTLRPPTLKDVASQLYRDWFGKDVQSTPTVSYVWTADQFGHFGLGFQITFLFSWILPLLVSPVDASSLALIAAALNLGIWILKEALDYIRERRQKGSFFPFNSRELLWNVLTALFYIACGAIIAGAAGFGGGKAAIISFLILLVPAVILLVWWVRRKMTFQQAGLPFLFRLANIRSKIQGDSESLRDATIALSTPPRGKDVAPPVNHLLITGSVGSGKTCLACGIGTEYAFRLGIARYTTLVKLLEAASPGKPGPLAPVSGTPLEEQDGRVLWPWRDVDLLIVDDVNAMLDETPLPPSFAQAVDRGRAQRRDDIAAWRNIVRCQLDAIEIRRFKDRRTVWVVSDPDEANSWLATIADALGFPANERQAAILTVRLERDENALAVLSGEPLPKAGAAA